MAAQVDSVVKLENVPPTGIILDGVAGYPGPGLKLAPHAAGADWTADDSLAAGIEMDVRWVGYVRQNRGG